MSFSSADQHGLTTKPALDTFVIITDPDHPYFNQLAFIQASGHSNGVEVWKLVFENKDYIEYPCKNDRLIRVNTYETMAHLRNLRRFIGEVEDAYYKRGMKEAFYRLEDAENELKALRMLMEMDATYWTIQQNNRIYLDPKSVIGLHIKPFVHPYLAPAKTLEEIEAIKLKKKDSIM